jgi:hypothetical protein
MTWAEIGRRLGISGQRAGAIFRDTLAAAPIPNREEHRTDEVEFVDLATKELLRIAADPATTPATAVECWRALRAWAERKAALLGLDEPARPAQLTLNAIDREIQKIEATHSADQFGDREWDDTEDDDTTD